MARTDTTFALATEPQELCSADHRDYHDICQKNAVKHMSRLLQEPPRRIGNRSRALKGMIRGTVFTMARLARLSSAYNTHHAPTSSWQSYGIALCEDEEIAIGDSIAAAALA